MKLLDQDITKINRMVNIFNSKTKLDT